MFALFEGGSVNIINAVQSVCLTSHLNMLPSRIKTLKFLRFNIISVILVVYGSDYINCYVFTQISLFA